MKKWLINILFFIICGVIVYLPAVWAAGVLPTQSNVRYLPGNYGHTGLRLSEADSMFRHAAPELILIGSSHSYRSFDTRMIRQNGISCMNLGSSNQTPRQSYALLKRYLKRGTPRMVVIEVHPDIMGNNGVESALDIVSNTRVDWPVFEMAVRQKSLSVINSMCCAMVDRIVHGDRSRTEPKIITVGTDSGDTTIMADFEYIDGGYVELTDYCYNPAPIEPQTITIDEEQLYWLDKCLQLLEERNIGCLLIEVPSSRNLYSSYTNHKEFENQINNLITYHRGHELGYRYLNLNDDSVNTELNDTTCFFDEDHLNRQGAKRVTRRVFERRTENGYAVILNFKFHTEITEITE